MRMCAREHNCILVELESWGLKDCKELGELHLCLSLVLKAKIAGH